MVEHIYEFTMDFKTAFILLYHIIAKIRSLNAMEAYGCNPSTEEAETRGWIQLQSQIGLRSEFKGSLNYG